uniref:RNase H type-1 domain-containing protein n=1 Tax=Leersia perrieri TaxID=77586 RepID=A0A0D9WKL5_9ORYZ
MSFENKKRKMTQTEGNMIKRWRQPEAAGAGHLPSVFDASCAEAEACCATLQAVLAHGISSISVETDSSQLVLALESQQHDHASGGVIFRELKFLIHLEFASFDISFAPRSCNSIAHEPAQLGVVGTLANCRFG